MTTASATTTAMTPSSSSGAGGNYRTGPSPVFSAASPRDRADHRQQPHPQAALPQQRPPQRHPLQHGFPSQAEAEEKRLAPGKWPRMPLCNVGVC